MKSENKLQGASNFRSWKKRMNLIFGRNKVLDLVQGKDKEPTDDARKEKYKENDIIAMRLIVDVVKDNLIPYMSTLNTSKSMYDALSKLFTIENIRQVASLKNELRTVKMTKDDIVSSYFVRISRIRNESQAVDEIFPNKKLVIATLLGPPKSWNVFAAGISSWKHTPSFEEMWTAYIQEEACLALVGGRQEDEEM